MRQPFAKALVGLTLAGRYELGPAIGAGGMSVVYRGLDKVLGRPVAVKVISLAAESEEVRANLRERFRREAGSAARLAQHPNVVQVYDYGTDVLLDLDFLVMELLRGRDLKQALQQDRIPQGEALRILREAARGLSAGHREGIVHRDVKPANLFLVGEEGRLDYVRVLDFGIAKPLEDDDDSLTLTTAGQLPHSPAYASPEQLDPGATVTAASDVYQLGLIGHELLTGERPYAESERARIAAGEQVPLVLTPRWSEVPGPVRAVIERALRRDPAQRFPDAGAFADALAHASGAAEDHTVLQPPPVIPAIVTPPAPEARIPVEPLSTDPLAQPAVIPPRRSTLLALLPVFLVLLGVAVWLLRRKDTETAVSSVPPADTSALAALNERFLHLQGEAARRLAGDSARPDTAARVAPPPAPAGDADAAQQVQAAVLDLHAAWSAGDMERMSGDYADRVDFYGNEGTSRSSIRRDRERTVHRYPQRRITIRRQAVLMESPTQARALVDKDWDFTGSGERWTGSMRQELILRLRDGRWQVVSEKSNQVYDERRTPL